MRLHRQLIALALLFLAAACSEAAEPEFSDVSGVYSLQLSTIPTVIITEPKSSLATLCIGGVLDLHPDWRFALSYTREDGSSMSLSGNYERTDSGVRLRYDAGFSETGTVEGDLLTITTGLREARVFRKVGS